MNRNDDTRATPAEGAAHVSGWPFAVILLIGAVCLTYVVSQFLRNSIGVIAPDLAAELALDPESLSLLSGIFFFVFAAAQFPLGVALDRWGPKACMLASIGLAVAGCLVFAWAGGFTELVLARVLMGLGCSSFFMAPLMLFSHWFAPERFSTLTGIQLGFGSFGTLLATGPLAYAAGTLGWRAAFLAFGALTVIAGVLVILFVRDRPPGARVAERAQESFLAGMIGLVRVARTRFFWPVFGMHLALYSCFATVLGLWGGPYLTDVYGIDLTGRGQFLFLLAAGQIAGLFVWGPSDRLFGSRKMPVVVSAAVSIALLVVVAIAGKLPLWALTLWFPLFGFLIAASPVLVAHGRGLFDERYVGRGITMMNVGTMGGVFVGQALTGLVAGRFASADSVGIALPETAYKAIFAVLALYLAVALINYLRAGDPSARHFDTAGRPR